MTISLYSIGRSLLASTHMIQSTPFYLGALGKNMGSLFAKFSGQLKYKNEYKNELPSIADQIADARKKGVGDQDLEFFANTNMYSELIALQTMPNDVAKKEWLRQKIPVDCLHAVLKLKKSIRQLAIQDSHSGIEQLKNDVLKKSDLKYGSISVTCNSSGNLILELHLAYQSGLNKIIEVGTINDKFYEKVLKNEKQDVDDFFNDATIQFALALKERIQQSCDPTVDGWTVKNFFDLACEYKNRDLDSITPDFYLDLMASGESITKYARKMNDIEFDRQNSYRKNPPVLYKTKDQLGVDYVHVISGPTLIQGKGFDANVIRGFFELLYQIAAGKKNLHISGHSRGAVEAICINNLLMFLKQMSAQKKFVIADFVQKHLVVIKNNLADFLPNHTSVEKHISDALDKSANLTAIKVGLSLLDPVQGPDTYGFNQKSFSIAKLLKLDEMHQRVDILMGSRENSPIGFDLHLPKLDNHHNVPCTIYKVNDNHKTMVEELHQKKRNGGIKQGKKAGSVEGHFAACVLSGRSGEIQRVQALVNNPKAARRIAPAYFNRKKVYGACRLQMSAGVTSISVPDIESPHD